MGLTRPQVHLLLALCTGVLIGLVMPNALSQRRTFIPPVAPRAVPTFAPTLAPSTSTPSPGPIKSALDALSHVREAEHLAEFVYKNQASLERGQRVNPLIASYEAEYPCMWGEYATGLAKTWREEWGTYMDGWKFTCGLPLITQPCVVYSLGSCGNMAFEAAVLQTLPECEIHVFDKDNFGLEKWFPDAAARSHVKFHRYFIASVDNLNANPPQRTLASIMAELGHTHLDILKADIEGAEVDLMRGSLPSIGQLLLEVHLGAVQDAATIYKNIFASAEACGLRLFHKEVNARYDANCVELAFIQAEWRPEKKSYSCAKRA